MEDFKNQLVAINQGKYTPEQLVSYFELIAEVLQIGSIKDVADRLGISDKGARKSNRLKKIKIGSCLLATDKLRNDKFPF